MFKTVDFEVDADVSLITLNRPEALNALSRQIAADLTAAIERAGSEGSRAIVITGRGRAFCAGGDLREMRSMWEEEGRIEAFLDEPLRALHRLVMLIRETPVPFVAAVEGVCAGAGTNLVLACDLVVAARGASFSQAFVKIGLSPDCGGSFFLPRAVGTKMAAEMMMTGDPVSAEKAAGMGMVNRLVGDGEAFEEAKRLANRLAQGPTAAIGRIKQMLNATFSNDLHEQLALEHRLQLESGRDPDFSEGVRAFFEKRDPRFSGR